MFKAALKSTATVLAILGVIAALLAAGEYYPVPTMITVAVLGVAWIWYLCFLMFKES